MNTSDLGRIMPAWRARPTVLATCAATITIFTVTMFTAPATARGGGEEDEFNLDWNTIDCGGGDADGVDEEADTWVLEGTVGQADAGPMDSGDGGDGADGGGAMTGVDEDGDTFALEGGYWPGAGGGVNSSCPWDIDHNGNIGLTDLLAVLRAWNTIPGGPPDFDGGGVGVSDLLAVLTNWGDCPRPNS